MSTLAIVLIVLGGVGLLSCIVIALLIAILLPALGAARQTARAVADQSNLRQIGVGMAAYAADNDDAVPPHPTMIYQYFGDPIVFDSPIDPGTPTMDIATPDILNEPSYRLGDYVFITIDGSWNQITDPGSTVYAYTARITDGQIMRSVLFMDGHTETLDDTSLQKRLPVDIDLTAHDDY